MRMNEIIPANVREWITDLQAKGVSAASTGQVDLGVHPAPSFVAQVSAAAVSAIRLTDTSGRVPWPPGG
jgi:hypothetical protein